jgi:hypothetical protein
VGRFARIAPYLTSTSEIGWVIVIYELRHGHCRLFVQKLSVPYIAWTAGICTNLCKTSHWSVNKNLDQFFNRFSKFSWQEEEWQLLRSHFVSYHSIVS